MIPCVRRLRTLALQGVLLVAATAACVDDAPLEPGEGSGARLALRASVAGLSSGVVYQVHVSVTYQAAQGSPKALRVNPDHFAVTGGAGSTEGEVTIDLASCLADTDRADPVDDGCKLAALVTLSDASGDLASDAIDLGVVHPQDRVTPHDTIVLVPTYPLLITGGGAGTGSGTVDVAAAGGQPAVSCVITEGQAAPEGCGPRYPIHTQLQLTTTTARGVFLSAWGGDCADVASADPCELTIEGPRAVAATFSLPPTTGDLEVQIAGLPSGTPAAVRVRNGDGFDQALTASGTLPGLPPGDYTVTAEPVNVPAENRTYQPTPATQTVTVALGETTVAQVGYNPPTTGSLAVEITGLPQGRPADVTVTGPSFPQGRSVTAAELLTNLTPGSYTITARSVTDAGAQPYDPAPATQTRQVAAGQGATAPVAYAAPAATKLVFIQSPSNVVSGAPITPAITVRIQDAQGRLAPGYAGQVLLALRGGAAGAKLGGATQHTPVRGVATFADLTVDLVGTQYVLVASSGNLTAATSATFNVTVGALSATRSTVELTPSTLRTCCDTALVTIRLVDANGNPIQGLAVELAASAGATPIQPVTQTDATGRTTARVWVSTIGSKSVAATVGGTTLTQAPLFQAIAGIAFESRNVSDGWIQVTSPSGSDPELLAVPASARQPAWSPDGSKLAMTVFNCVGDGACENDIFVSNANGTGAVNVTRGRGQDGFSKFNPSWSPDGKKIAFELDRCGNGCIVVGIGTVEVAGGEIVNLTPNRIGVSDPAWSPDGRTIAFVQTDCIDSPCRTAVYIVDAGTPSKIAALSPTLSGEASSPAWSPDGKRMVFSLFLCIDHCDSDLLVFSPGTGSEPVNITSRLKQAAVQPTWSPDGSRIAFTKLDGCVEGCSIIEIALIDPDGGNEGSLLPGENPTWR
jgi:hypothetical protein